MQDRTRRHKLIGIAALTVLSWSLQEDGPLPAEPSGMLARVARQAPEPPSRRERLELQTPRLLLARWSGDQRTQPAGVEPAYR